MNVTELKCWRWLPGMLIAGGSGIRVASETDDEGVYVLSGRDEDGEPVSWLSDLRELGAKPDLHDPATQGAIVLGLLAPLNWVATFLSRADVARLFKSEPETPIVRLFKSQSPKDTSYFLAHEAIQMALQLEG